MPDLRDLPDGSRVFVDTNIFDLAYRAASASCVDLIERIARGEITAYVNIQVLSDLLHKLMLMEAQQKKIIAKHLGCMNRCKNSRRKAPLCDIVTYDGDFDHIVGVTVWRPQDVAKLPPVGASFMTP
jgi:hypothetical protein